MHMYYLFSNVSTDNDIDIKRKKQKHFAVLKNIDGFIWDMERSIYGEEMVTELILLVLGIVAALLCLYGNWYISISQTYIGAMEYANTHESCGPFGGYFYDMA
ncbi:hypothetical protein GWI33_021971 [Rhynchophorus ferrugineus]|uniref:Uncharacterized protein n=1 Tax=Rhynchophorus ferrugineus TaxID=354439 RepID=A0A834LZF4_RHYFE|nr:hypothetical protein GWI33_021971 [Rhynchophorus ferrugineus]